MISIVCVYNDENLLDNWLLKSLKDQTAGFELIAVDNTKNIFKVAAEVLNYGGRKSKGDYIMFVHQDVDLFSNTWLTDTEKMLDSIPNLGIAGVAGLSEEERPDGNRWRTVIEHGVPPQRVIVSPINPLQKPEKVQTLDECLVIVPRAIFDKLKFDEEVCNGWHLYAADYCLSAKRLGLDVYVIPTYIHHKSTGVLTTNFIQVILFLGHYPREYYKILQKILEKHKNDVSRIYTSCNIWSTSRPLIWQRIVIVAKYILRRLGFRYLYRKSGLKYLWVNFLNRYIRVMRKK